MDGILNYVEWTQRLQRPRKQRTHFANLARELRQRVNAEFGDSGGCTIENDETSVDVDSGLFLDSILELVRNARKFGAKDTRVHVSMRSRDGAAVVEVTDNGPGIPPEHLERIFQRFYQVESDFTGQVNGLGLGLSRVQRAMQAMGAQLEVDSKLDHGVRFTISL